MSHLKRKIINFLLVLILFLAPFESLFAHTTHNQTTTKSTLSTYSLELHSNVCQVNKTTMDHNGLHKCHHNNGLQCENCVFCNAIMISYSQSIEKTLFVYNPGSSFSLIDRIPDLDIRPPKSSTIS